MLVTVVCDDLFDEKSVFGRAVLSAAEELSKKPNTTLIAICPKRGDVPGEKKLWGIFKAIAYVGQDATGKVTDTPVAYKAHVSWLMSNGYWTSAMFSELIYGNKFLLAHTCVHIAGLIGMDFEGCKSAMLKFDEGLEMQRCERISTIISAGRP